MRRCLVRSLLYELYARTRADSHQSATSLSPRGCGRLHLRDLRQSSLFLYCFQPQQRRLFRKQTTGWLIRAPHAGTHVHAVAPRTCRPAMMGTINDCALDCASGRHPPCDKPTVFVSSQLMLVFLFPFCIVLESARVSGHAPATPSMIRNVANSART